MKNILSFIFGAMTLGAWWITFAVIPGFVVLAATLTFFSLVLFITYLVSNWEDLK